MQTVETRIQLMLGQLLFANLVLQQQLEEQAAPMGAKEKSIDGPVGQHPESVPPGSRNPA